MKLVGQNVLRGCGLLVMTLLVGCAVTVSEMASQGEDHSASRQGKLVIAHRGASGYLPEHTLEAKAMAYAQGADFIEQDLVMSKDDHVIVLHDLYLDTVTDVAEVFPGRTRSDGRYYVVDFTLAELRQLSVFERFKLADGPRTRVFEERFPLERASFRIATFAEEIELIQGLNLSTGSTIGIYPEIKNPAFHHDEGKDIAAAALEVLISYGYRSNHDRVFFQCFDAGELQRIHADLLPAMDINIPLVQLLRPESEDQLAITSEQLEKIAAYAAGIGPSMHLIVHPESAADNLQVSSLVRDARQLGMVVHPYTFRRDLLPAYAADYDELLRIFLDDIGVDGVFTDFPDLTVEFIESGS